MRYLFSSLSCFLQIFLVVSFVGLGTISAVQAQPTQRIQVVSEPQLPSAESVFRENDSNRIYQEGVAADAAGNELEARKAYTRAALLGHMMAQYRLAEKCLAGKGGPKDPSRGFEMLELAGAQGGPNMWYAISRLYLQQPESTQTEERARFWLTKAARRGDSFSQALLGTLFLMGKGGDQDYPHAYFWLSLASRKDPQYKKICTATQKLLTPKQLREAEKEINAFTPQK